MKERSVRRMVCGWAFLVFASTAALACGDLATAKGDWILPGGSRFIETRSVVQIHAQGIPPGVQAESIQYRKNKYLFRAPSGSERWWEIRQALVLKQDGKPFAFLARVYHPILNGRGRVVDTLGCVTDVAIYDEDGDGRFEAITDTRDSNNQLFVHLPGWVQELREQHTPALPADSQIANKAPEAKLLHFVAPPYPRDAKDKRIMGSTSSIVTVTKEGSVSAVRTIHAHPVFETVVSDALKQWRFQPSSDGYSLEVAFSFEFYHEECEKPLTPETYVSAELPSTVTIRTGIQCVMTSTSSPKVKDK